MTNKRGISPVIATILLVFLTLVAVTIIAGIVVPFVKESLEGTSCLDFREYYKFEEAFGYNCYINDQHGITVRATQKSIDLEKLKGFDVVFLNDNNLKKVSIREGDLESCGLDGMRNLTSSCNTFEILPISGMGGYSAFTYVYHGGGETYNKAEIYPVITGEEVCEISDTIKLSQCKSGVTLG